MKLLLDIPQLFAKREMILINFQNVLQIKIYQSKTRKVLHEEREKKSNIAQNNLQFKKNCCID